ncbi:MAG TPA: hypothetical protein VKG80_05565 [Trebonia sp.]|nr:hypothetical protein [Trebonia sp.]
MSFLREVTANPDLRDFCGDEAAAPAQLRQAHQHQAGRQVSCHPK